MPGGHEAGDRGVPRPLAVLHAAHEPGTLRPLRRHQRAHDRRCRARPQVPRGAPPLHPCSPHTSCHLPNTSTLQWKIVHKSSSAWASTVGVYPCATQRIRSTPVRMCGDGRLKGGEWLEWHRAQHHLPSAASAANRLSHRGLMLQASGCLQHSPMWIQVVMPGYAQGELEMPLGNMGQGLVVNGLCHGHECPHCNRLPIALWTSPMPSSLRLQWQPLPPPSTQQSK